MSGGQGWGWLGVEVGFLMQRVKRFWSPWGWLHDLENILKITELHAFKEGILWFIHGVSIKEIKIFFAGVDILEYGRYCIQNLLPWKPCPKNH